MLPKKNDNKEMRHTRRSFLKATTVLPYAISTVVINKATAQKIRGGNETAIQNLSQSNTQETYETHAKGIRILPGQWRPHYPFEQIAWISPPWPSQDYIWLDFPEAIFCNLGCIYLSHVNPQVEVVFSDLERITWQKSPSGLSFERVLPNGVNFGGSLSQTEPSIVSMELYIKNGTNDVLRRIRLQTCAFLRGITEFSEYSTANKFVYLEDQGWQNLEQARGSKLKGKYPIGFRGGGPAIADLPVMVTLSSKEQRLVAMTWYESTISMISNPRHPCMHADPGFPDLEPGEKKTIQGELLFFEGTLNDFSSRFENRINNRE
jgi:hypothetical protein